MEFRDVPGFPGYRVGSDGSVRSSWRRSGFGKRSLDGEWVALRPRESRKRGAVYHKVVLFRNGERHAETVHAIVLGAFVGPRPEGMEARHLNDEHTDNRVENLCWGTRRANAADRRRNEGYRRNPRGEKHGNARLDAEKVRAIRASGLRQRNLASAFGVSVTTIKVIRARRTWRHVA